MLSCSYRILPLDLQYFDGIMSFQWKVNGIKYQRSELSCFCERCNVDIDIIRFQLFIVNTKNFHFLRERALLQQARMTFLNFVRGKV